MALSRLQNILRSPRGTIIYVDVNAIDATDNIENTGTSPLVPFKSIQRALIECSRVSYQAGSKNDRFNFTTVVVNPGTYSIDNRPGFIPVSITEFRKRSGEVTNDFSPWDTTTNFNLTSENNVLYKLNSIFGGVILPKGCSLVCMDIRKTKFRPLYVPNPENANIERSAVFRLTGGSYLYGFSILDSDPNGFCYKDYTTNKFVPNFSHHKLTVFEYADGVNHVNINDAFLSYSIDRTDLQMYYEKVGIAYGESSGREVFPDFPSSVVDIEPVVDEYRIVGSRGNESQIVDIISGNGVTSTNIITVTLQTEIPELNVDTAIQIQGVGASGYDGQFVVYEIVSSTILKYKTQNPPANPDPTVVGATLNLVVDTVNSASPYIYNCSLRSVYGMCGLHADGSKADGFKSMVVSQYTGIGLQKDNNAFVLYDEASGSYLDSTSVINLYKNTKSRFKPEYENYHIKASNDAFVQLVSVFAIGYAQHFLAESGGDHSITNSNSNFGAKSLVASGFRNEAFIKDDVGYLTHIIPPKEISNKEVYVEFTSIDIGKTVGIGSTDKLYLYNENNLDSPPTFVVDGYRIGGKPEDYLKYEYNNIEYQAKIAMPNTQYSPTVVSNEKSFTVGRNSVGINSISGNILTLTQNHSLINGESIRLISNNGQLPDGIKNNRIYYTITTGVSANQVKIAKTLNDAVNANSIDINNRGGIISVVSRVSDKLPGDIGHPIQWSGDQWYLTVSGISTENNIYDNIVGLGTTSLGSSTVRTFITRKNDNRRPIDTTYRVRYVIPKNAQGRPPLEGYVIEESNGLIPTEEITKAFSPSTSTLNGNGELKTFKFISSASYSAGKANFVSELPHQLSVGSVIEVNNIVSTANTTGAFNAGYNKILTVNEITGATQFNAILDSDPGTFSNNTSERTSDLPYFKQKKYKNTFQIYKVEEIQEYIFNDQDGIYYLTLINSSNSPTVSPFSVQRFSQPTRNLYPQLNRDNPISDPSPTATFALPNPIGEVVVNNPEFSLTKETILKTLSDQSIGFGITNIVSNSVGSAHTIYTASDHNLNGVAYATIQSAGSSYTPGNYYGVETIGFGASVVGNNATFRITVDGGGSISSVRLMNSGSAYGVGNTLSPVNLPGGSGGVLLVNNINNSINNVIDVNNTTINRYNNLYVIDNIPTGKHKEIIVSSINDIGSPITGVGIGVTATINSRGFLTGKRIGVSSIAYDKTSGIATITTVENHGFDVNNKVVISGASNPYFNVPVIITQVNKELTPNQLKVDVGISTVTQTTGGTLYLNRPAYTSNAGEVNSNNESRIIPYYAGISTTLGAAYLRTDDDTITNISIPNAVTLGFKLGDYLQIDNEIFRIRTTVTSSSVAVYRGLLGSKKDTHFIGSVIRKINVLPIEFRRSSIIRSSGHTNEYVGFGPGNYSTSLPEVQDRKLTAQEQIIAQSTKYDGGSIVYTSMSDDGSIYSNTKKINGITGEEETIGIPVRTAIGEELPTNDTNAGFNVINPIEVNVSRSLTVEGGENNNIISRFDSPVIFNNKITSLSDEGVEVVSLYLQGDSKVSKRYTVGISTPSYTGNSGDITNNTQPISGGTVGWVYTQNNEWREYGPIQDDSGKFVGNYSGSFTGDGSGLTNITSDNFYTAWSVDLVGIHTTTSVGINTNTANANYALYVGGVSSFDRVVISGIVTVTNSPVLIGMANSTGTQSQRLQVGGKGYFSDHLGLGTTNPGSRLTVVGDGSFSGVVTATSFNGSALNVTSISGSTLNVTGISGSTLNVTGISGSRLNVTGISTLSNVTAGVITCTDINSTSDLAFKKDVTPIENAIDLLSGVRGVNFKWKQTDQESIGVIAQELEKVLPQLVSQSEIKSVNYNGLIGVLIQAVKELKDEIDVLKLKIK